MKLIKADGISENIDEKELKSRIGSATSRYIDQLGQNANSIILEAEESAQSSPELSPQKKRKIKIMKNS